MKFDDSDEDYFLHDFSRKDRQSEEDQRHSPTPDPSDPATRPAAPSFDFPMAALTVYGQRKPERRAANAATDGCGFSLSLR